MKYVEFCAGIGGTRAGLDAAGWECVLAVDHDPDAIAVHRLAHGSALEADVTNVDARDVPYAQAWVAGFPCQPFSSSGARMGFGHRSGHVFQHLIKLIRERLPNLVVLENVEGVLSNKSGHTFATILRSLTESGYCVDWLVVDLRWFRVPQSRPRLFVVAARPGSLVTGRVPDAPGLLPSIGSDVPYAFVALLDHFNISWSRRVSDSLSGTVDNLQPAIGKASPLGPRVFAGMGHAEDDWFVSYDLQPPCVLPPVGALASIVAPEFRFPEEIRSARYWSPQGGGGVAGLHLRAEPLSHCVGTSLGGAPLFAVPLAMLSKRQDRNAFLAHSNWHREQNGLLVKRLTPERSVLLFGPHVDCLYKAVCDWGGSATRKFKLVGNMVAPICAEAVAALVTAQSRDSIESRKALR
jgi:site-specific DNA-cytosine methylase